MVYSSPCPPPAQGAGQEAEGRVGTQGLVMGLGATLSFSDAGQPHVKPCKFSLARLTEKCRRGWPASYLGHKTSL